MEPPSNPFAALVLAPLLFACGAARTPDPNQGTPGLVFPARIAEGDNEAEKARASRARPAPANAEPAPPPGAQPDPEPLRLAEQYEYELAYERGQVSVRKVTPRTFAAPVVTARRMGRYAIELWIGQELVDRVRFDFPLTAADDTPARGPRPFDAPPDLGAGVSARQKVLVPKAPRARRALLVDRATGATQELPWPPDRANPSAPAAAEPAGGESPRP